jgi:hypothetical protein
MLSPADYENTAHTLPGISAATRRHPETININYNTPPTATKAAYRNRVHRTEGHPVLQNERTCLGANSNGTPVQDRDLPPPRGTQKARRSCSPSSPRARSSEERSERSSAPSPGASTTTSLDETRPNHRSSDGSRPSNPSHAHESTRRCTQHPRHQRDALDHLEIA